MPQTNQNFSQGAKQLKANPPPYTENNKKYDGSYKNGDRPPPFVPTRQLNIDFSNNTISPLTIWGDDSLIVASDNPPPGGGLSMMGSLAAGGGYGLDPRTNKARNASPANFNIAGITNGESRTWPGVYLEYDMRFDDADNNGTADINGVPTKVVSAPKLGYGSCTKTTFETGSAFYPTLAPLEGIREFARNQNAEGGDPAPAWPGSAIQSNCDALNFSYDGQWRKVQVYVDHVNHTLEVWIDGIKAKGRSIYTDGIFPLSEIFTFDNWRFFHGNPPVWNQSANRNGEKGRFQIANIEVWNGNPKGVVDGYV